MEECIQLGLGTTGLGSKIASDFRNGPFLLRIGLQKQEHLQLPDRGNVAVQK